MDVNAVRSVAATFVTDTTNPPPPRHRWLRRGRFDLVEMADIVTALIFFAITNAVLATDNARHAHQFAGLMVLLAFITCAPLALRTRFPLPAWAGTAVGVIVTSVVIPPSVLFSSGYLPVVVLIFGLCLYAVTVRCRPRIVIAAAAVTVAGAAFLDPGSTVAAVFLAAVPLLLGTVVRVWRSGELRLAEQERRHSGERALLEERQRIARELHDVVAHHMSVIAIQAEAAPYKTADPPRELVESFGEIRASALAGLGELRRVLGVLRADGQSTAPQPGLAGLDALFDSARSGGVSVTATVSGDPVALPDGVDLSAYRIVQEALSNAMRHAPGSHVRVHVAYGPDSVALEVSNGAGPRPAAAATRKVPVAVTSSGGTAGENGTAGTPEQSGEDRAARGGHGIIGMRERAAMLGGSLDAGPTDDGGFRVTAVLPVGSGHDGDAA
jgi:signal transduction histidine kinase